MNTGGFPYLTLRWLTAGSTCAHIQSSTEKCGSIWWPWRRRLCTTVLQHAHSCTTTNNHTHAFIFTWGHSQCCTHTIKIWNWNLPEIYTGIYIICTVYPLWFPSLLLFTLFLAPTLSALFPGWPYLCSAIVQGGNDEKWSYNASC